MKFDYGEFDRQVTAIKGDYKTRGPFPYAVFDGLFDPQLVAEINAEIDQQRFALDDRDIADIEVKVRSNFEDNEDMPPAIKRAFDVLNGGKFLGLVSELTGVAGLVSDPYFDGGGVNCINPGGTLAVHVDGTTHQRTGLCRRLNAILYLNEDWQDDWGGHYEQWEYLDRALPPLDDSQTWRCARKIRPSLNRLVIFTTNDQSWHGHPGRLACPDDRQRRSLISYFYTVDRPESDLAFGEQHRALFVNNKITRAGDHATSAPLV